MDEQTQATQAAPADAGLTKEKVMAALQQVNDPEIPCNIVDLGLVYGVVIDKDMVKVKMTLTSPGCPMSQSIATDVKTKVELIDGVKEADVEIVWDPIWTPDKMTDEGKKKLGMT